MVYIYHILPYTNKYCHTRPCGKNPNGLGRRSGIIIMRVSTQPYPLYKLFQNRLYNCHPCRQDRADCLLLIDTRDEMNRVIISSGNRQSFGIALIRLAVFQNVHLKYPLGTMMDGNCATTDWIVFVLY